MAVLSAEVKGNLAASPTEDFSLTLGRVEATQQGGISLVFEIDRPVSAGDGALIERVNGALRATLQKEPRLRRYAIDVTVDAVVRPGDGG